MSQPFVPKYGEEDAFLFDHTPTYLFRVHTPYSAGSTTDERVSTPVHNRLPARRYSHRIYCHKDLLQVGSAQAAQRLTDHLWGMNHDHHNRCNLMSWSSSLLFVLQYGLFLHKKYERPCLSDTWLTMIDTRKFPERSFLRDLDAIRYYYPKSPNITELEKLNEWREGNWYFGEYLTQGSLDVKDKCSQVSMQQLINTGLFYLCPSLMLSQDNDWTTWPKAVCKIRRSDFDTQATDDRHVRTAIWMARMAIGMEERLAFPFAVMLLALQGRDANEAQIEDSFQNLSVNITASSQY